MDYSQGCHYLSGYCYIKIMNKNNEESSKQKSKEYIKNWRKKNLVHRMEYKKRYRALHPEDQRRDRLKRKLSGHNIANERFYWVSRKISSDQKKCQICGELRAEFHHPDYNDWYRGYFLCRPHHRAVHLNSDLLNDIKLMDYNHLIKPKHKSL